MNNTPPKDFLTEARKYTKRNLSRTKDYKMFKDNDYYHINKYTTYLWNQLQKNQPKEYIKITKKAKSIIHKHSNTIRRKFHE